MSSFWGQPHIPLQCIFVNEFSKVFTLHTRYYEQVDGKTVDITKEIPFDLPDGWTWARIRCILLQTGSKIPTGVYFDYIDIDAIDNNTNKITEPKHILVKNAPSRASREIFPGDTLFSLVRPYLKNIALVAEAHRDYIASTGFYVCRPSCGANCKYLFYTMISDFTVNGINSFIKGDNSPSVRREDIENFVFPLPPLAEQQRIAEQIERLLQCVDEIDRESETLEKSLALAKQKILDLAIRGKLVPQDPDDEPASELLKKIKAEKETLIKAGKLKRDKHESFIFRGDDNCYHENIDGKINDITGEIPFDLPDGWAWCRLKKIGNILYGVSESAKQNGRYKLLRITDIQNDSVNWQTVPYTDFSEDASAYFLQNDDIVFARTGATVGKSFLIDSAPVNAIYASYLIRVRFIFPLLAKFIKHFFGSSDYWNQIIAKSVGTGQPNVNGTSLSELLLPLPPLAEQKRIVLQVEKLFSLLETMRG